MKSKKQKDPTNDLFLQRLDFMCDPRQALVKLAEVLPWDYFEKEFEGLYSEEGRPAKPIRLMVGVLLLKQLENLSDERVCEAWRRDPYMQYFCGEEFFRWNQPCDPTDLIYFRKRLGEEGVEKIFAASVNLHQQSIEKEDEVVADTTVQEANVTYPTDTKMRRKIIERMWKMGEEAGVKWSRSYVRTVPKLLATLRTRSNRMVKNRRKAEKRLKTLGGRLIREFRRRASSGWLTVYREDLELFEKVLKQGRTDKGKIYSLHDPEVLCIAKGKAHKKYVPRNAVTTEAKRQFGRKASVVMLAKSGVIVGAKSFKENLYDGDTLDPALWQVRRITGKWPRNCLVDKGYRGRPEVVDTKIELPRPIPKSLTTYEKAKERKRRGRRSAIEPVIGHLKSDFRMARCFLKGAFGASMNLMLAAAAWNLRKWVLFVFIWRLVQKLKRAYVPPFTSHQILSPCLCASA